MSFKKNKTKKTLIIWACIFFCIMRVFAQSTTSTEKDYADAHWRVYEIEVQLINQKQYDLSNTAFVTLFSEYDYRFAEGYSVAFANLWHIFILRC
ncbi:MAG: hypothetical protein LBQ31_06255 [Bacteroidales bacterium]|jgi:hypothetical protein|nr:hypothetical protein [Bacteroidales bacterium]